MVHTGVDGDAQQVGEQLTTFPSVPTAARSQNSKMFAPLEYVSFIAWIVHATDK